MIPLSLQGDKIAAASGTGPTVLEKLRDGMSLNQRESADGALVFGCTSTQGPASLIDSTIGSVSCQHKGISNHSSRHWRVALMMCLGV